MGIDFRTLRPWGRGLALVTVVVCGLYAVIGSGGGGGAAPECSFFSNSCNPTIGPPPPTPAVRIEPARITLQVGSASTFSTQLANIDNPSYQWCRTDRGAGTCIALAGVTGSGYTLAAATLADDGARLRVTVSGSNGIATAESVLAVSAMPGVRFGDGDFGVGSWDVEVITTPSVGGPGYRAERLASGGSPDAWFRVAVELQQANSSLRAFHLANAAVYDPAVQGAIHVIDFGEDCIAPAGSTSNVLVFTTPLLTQAGRRYTARSTWSWACTSTTWLPVARAVGLARDDFVQVDGPACAAGQACPDFSATAAPLRFGFVRSADGSGGAQPGVALQGTDNWRVTVWRP